MRGCGTIIPKVERLLPSYYPLRHICADCQQFLGLAIYEGDEEKIKENAKEHRKVNHPSKKTPA